MKIQYLHLSVYLCEKCNGPVVAGVLAVRENEISRETDTRQVGALCLTCGHGQQKPKEPGHIRNFPPIRWESVNASASSPANTVDTAPLAPGIRRDCLGGVSAVGIDHVRGREIVGVREAS